MMTLDEIMKEASRQADSVLDTYWKDVYAAMLADGAAPAEVDEVVTNMRIELQRNKAREFRHLRRSLESET